MDAKQFLALNEQIIAINTLMSGQLSKETADAKAALDALGGAKAINAIQAQLDQDKADFEAYKENAEAQIKADRDSISQAIDKLTKDQELYQSKVDSLDSERSSLGAEKSQFESDKAAYEQSILDAQNALADAQAKVTQQSNDLSAAQRDVDAREAAVADKLAKLKAIA